LTVFGEDRAKPAFLPAGSGSGRAVGGGKKGWFFTIQKKGMLSREFLVKIRHKTTPGAEMGKEM
jgi:hypothetical protein